MSIKLQYSITKTSYEEVSLGWRYTSVIWYICRSIDGQGTVAVREELGESTKSDCFESYEGTHR